MNANKLKYDLRTVMPFVMLGLGVNLFTFIIGFLAIINTSKIKEIGHKVLRYFIKI